MPQLLVKLKDSSNWAHDPMLQPSSAWLKLTKNHPCFSVRATTLWNETMMVNWSPKQI